MAAASKWEISAPRVIAHRGASAYAPENTLAAFRLASKMGAGAIELDAKLLKDGTIVVHHDKTLNRTTNGHGSIYQFSYQEIESLDAGSHFSLEYSNEKIPTLVEVFSEMGSELLINVELTNYHRPWDKLATSTVDLVREFNFEEIILLSSFNPWVLVQTKRIEPTISRALLVNYRTSRLLSLFFQSLIDCTIIHPQHSLIGNEGFARFAKDYRYVNAWTVNDPLRMREVVALGVSGIITDTPDVAIDIWDELGKES